MKWIFNLSVFLLLIVFEIFISNRSHAASFDCNKAYSPEEIAICTDVELSALDSKLGRVFREARNSARDRRSGHRQRKIYYLARVPN
jgi:uncharacterized protein